MKAASRIICLSLLFAFLVACNEAEPKLVPKELSDAEREKITAEGAAVSKALMTTLGTQLKSAMASGGPEAAMGVCSTVAQPMTNSVGAEYEKVSVSRVSLKNRNPKNAADPIDAGVLQSWQAMSDSDEELPESEIRFDAETGQAIFYKPIQIQEVCLNCHGDPAAFKPGVVAVLKETYPEDKATGYKLGDLRGAFRVLFEPGSNALSQSE